jgi:hypothetical protein
VARASERAARVPALVFWRAAASLRAWTTSAVVFGSGPWRFAIFLRRSRVLSSAGGCAVPERTASASSRPQSFWPRVLATACARSSCFVASVATICSRRVLAAFCAVSREGGLRLHQVFEAEDAGEGVVELRGAFVEKRAQLVVGEERPVGLDRCFPAEGVECRLRLAGDLDGGLRLVERRALSPLAPERARGLLALDEQLGLDVRLRVMEVAPAFAPDFGALGPAEGVAGHEQLEGLGEAGLAGAVAADDEGEAGAGLYGQGGRRADATEAFDGDGAEVGAGGGLLGCCRGCGFGCGSGCCSGCGRGSGRGLG